MLKTFLLLASNSRRLIFSSLLSGAVMMPVFYTFIIIIRVCLPAPIKLSVPSAIGVALPIFLLGNWLSEAVRVWVIQTKMPAILQRKDYPDAFSALEMLWPKRLREEVWHPAFYDEQTLYLELRERSWLPMLNVIFTLKVFYLVVVTGRIAFLDWSLSRLTNKRSRLTGKATRRKGRTD